MSRRFQRGKTAGISPFFAFQDIITSAMAVVITIVMLLALDMGDPTQGSSGEPASAELAQALEKLLNELSEANASLKSAQDKMAAATLNPERLKSEVLALRRDLEALAVRDPNASKLLNSDTAGEGDKPFAIEIAKLNAAAAEGLQQISDLKKETGSSLTALRNAEKELETKQSQLLAEQSQKNELKLIPERSNTSKEPVILVVSSSRIVIQRLDNPEKSTLEGSGLASKFNEALKKNSPLEQHLIFYFKPTGIKYFAELTSAAKTAGFEIGYDAVLEDVNITFAPSK